MTRSALAHIVQSTHATLDPQRVAEFLVSWAPTWWPVHVWAVVTADVTASSPSSRSAGCPKASLRRRPGRRGVGWCTAARTSPARDLSHDSRLAAPAGGSAVAAVGFLLRGREQAVGALVGLDAGRPQSEPALSAGVREAWRPCW